MLNSSSSLADTVIQVLMYWYFGVFYLARATGGEVSVFGLNFLTLFVTMQHHRNTVTAVVINL